MVNINRLDLERAVNQVLNESLIIENTGLKGLKRKIIRRRDLRSIGVPILADACKSQVQKGERISGEFAKYIIRLLN